MVHIEVIGTEARIRIPSERYEEVEAVINRFALGSLKNPGDSGRDDEWDFRLQLEPVVPGNPITDPYLADIGGQLCDRGISFCITVHSGQAP